jgi:lysophospholipase L1-like esterase
MTRAFWKVSAHCVLVASLAWVAPAQTPEASGHWVSAWSTAVQAPLSFPGMPSTPSFENQSIRMVVRTMIGGERFRVRLSNELGTAPFSIGSAHIALLKENGSILPNTDHVLNFGGLSSVTVPAGAPILSDAVDLKIAPFAEIAISIFLPKQTAPATFHQLGQHDTYISEPGDFTGAAEMPNPKTTRSWYFLSGVDVWATSQTFAIVALGDSITDGAGAKAQYGDWPNLLAQRQADSKVNPAFAVVNAGIGGNRILHDGAGVSALARFDRDVLSQSGIKNLIILEGINDIGWPEIKSRNSADGSTREGPFARERVSASDLIVGMKQMIDRAREHGIHVFGATMTPYEGASVFTDDGEHTRQAVNEWIRNGGAFDGVFDFDAAVRDPNHQTKFREDLQSGDFLHPNAAGYKVMAATIDLQKLKEVAKH